MKRPPGRRKDNIKIDLKEVSWEGVGWINFTQDRDQWRAVRNTAMNAG
jgi:hypothetical protein